MASANKLHDETLFGLFANGVPPNLDAALADLPDAGIDSTFCDQVLSGVLAQSRASLGKMLSAAEAANVLPASYAAIQQTELATLDALRVASVGTTRYIRGKTSLNDLLAAGSVAQNVQGAFTRAYAANGGRLGPTWKTLRADKSLTKADLATLNTVLSAGELLTGNLLLVKDTLQRLSRRRRSRACAILRSWIRPIGRRASASSIPTPPQFPRCCRATRRPTGSRDLPSRWLIASPGAIRPRPSPADFPKRAPRPSPARASWSRS